MPRICLFPGTFDPVTNGHVDIISRALDLFDELNIGVGVNSGKTAMFTVEQRVNWFKSIYKEEPKVKVYAYSGLTVEFCNRLDARFILRGIRYVSDFEYEKSIADMNRQLDHGIETIFLTCSPRYSTIASTLVRDVILNGGDASRFLPEPVTADVVKQFPHNPRHSQKPVS
ncbi:MAG TPA: pantetheine-phosphate adenylyltransferase [Chitinophagaceae bacterium]|nr:pantetheine-phosphate adenylyltransferase [Chitinophagaceae bacterium]